MLLKVYEYYELIFLQFTKVLIVKKYATFKNKYQFSDSKNVTDNM